MAMSNKERQARWRARLKARAEAKSKIEEVLREHMSALFLDKTPARYGRDDEAELREAAAHILLGQSDEDLMRVVNAFLIAWRDEELEALREELRREVQRDALKSIDWRIKR